MSSCQFRILGPLEVHSVSGEIRIPPGRQEIVLAALVLNFGRVLDSSYLVDLIWAQGPPETARAQVQTCVSNLRKALSDTDATIETQGRGYRLNIAPGATDVGEFRRLVAVARAAAQERNKAQAVKVLRQAAELWRGPCMAMVPSDLLSRAAVQLDEERIEALEMCLGFELELGGHNRVVGELRQLITEYPLRERLHVFLMKALHHSGRQAEALEAYRQVRELFAEELGLDPGKELRDLEAAILADERSLPEAVETEQSAVQAPPAEDGAPTPATAGEPVIVPRQLPAGVSDFVGDATLIDQIKTVVIQTQRAQLGPVLFLGSAGVGKSTMAVHIAHRLAAEYFPDGQLYCDMHGGSGAAAEPGHVLGRFLRALGLPGQAIPEALDERVELYRSMLAGRRLLVVLDDARDEAQIRQLIPGDGQCVVLVTSNRRMTALPGAHRFDLQPLALDKGIELLGRVIGEPRVSAEVDTARALVQLVGGLPLALRIIAARLAARPHWSLLSMARRLEDEHRRLDELAHGELSIRASLALSYQGLAPGDRRTLVLLAAASGAELPSWVGAALTDDHGPEPSEPLEPLIDMRLVEIGALEPSGDFRLVLPQTVQIFAADQMNTEVSLADRDAAIRRLLGAWISLAEYAHRQVYGGMYTIVRGEAEQWHLPSAYISRQLKDPVGWLEKEHVNLARAVDLAAEIGFSEASWQLCTLLVTLFEARGCPDLWDSTHRTALQAVNADGNQRGQAAVLRSLGSLHLRRGEYEAATPYISAALELFQGMEDATGSALCQRDQALAYRYRNENEKALELYRQAEQNFVVADDAIGEAHVLSEAAYILMQRSDYTSARSYLNKALGISRSAGFDRGEAMALRRIGQLNVAQREFEDARRPLSEALAMVRASGDLVGETYLLMDLGRVDAELGRAESAMQYFTQSITIRDRIRDHRGAEAARREATERLGQQWLRNSVLDDQIR
ncbi:AfsR/SARP family transcriptional regulator [Streptomyces sp. NPDC093065]|uniref:AfsR/SARP family transcriptional regulator n=1 Tax=Streptomyces sp. NPDC093065 TaxID=3366021 RepID=UPI00381CC6C9